jgi:hypothetical protein
MLVRRTNAILVTLVLGPWLSFAADPQPQYGPRQASATVRAPALTSTKPAAPKLMDFVAETHKEAVAAVLKAPTISAKSVESEFSVYPNVYDWLLEHPDRTSLAWQRLEIPCVDITDLGKGQFYWTDEHGSELSWQTVGSFENGRIWFATGKVKGGMLLPTIPVKAVAVLQAPRSKTDEDGVCRIKPQVHVYIQSDSGLTTAALKLIGPAAPKMAEDGAEQLLFYFSGIARTIYKRPEKLEMLLGPKVTTKKTTVAK